MAVITGIGTYIPKYRFDRKHMGATIGWVNPAGVGRGEKAVGNFDEDSVTLGVEAVRDLQNKIGRKALLKAKALYFATTTAPFKERISANIIALALDLPEHITTADFTDSPGALGSALKAAMDAANAGNGPTIVVAADMRLAEPGSPADFAYGDAAAALFVEKQGEGLEINGYYSTSKDFLDHWRGSDDDFDRIWEERWIRDAGFIPFLIESIEGVIDSAGIKKQDIGMIALPDIYVREAGKILRKLDIDTGVASMPLSMQIGYTGNPHSVLALAATIEARGLCNNIILTTYGYGSQAFLLNPTQHTDIKEFSGILKQLQHKVMIQNYTKYSIFRGTSKVYKGIRGETQAPTALNLLYRQRREVFGLVGSVCKRCGTPQYPAQRVCVNPDCRAIDEMEPYRFADLEATVFSYTEDNLAYTPNPPAIYGLMDFDGGGRFWFDITDVEPGQVKVGSRVRFVFRVKYTDKDRGLKGYFWKATLTGGQNG